MCKMFVVNSLYLGNRSLGLELWDGKGVVEMTEKQVRDGIIAGKEIYGLKVAANGIDLDIDTEGYYMNNLVIHRHIGNYKPMFDTDNPVSIMYIVTGMREENGAKVYDLISSRFEKKAVNEDMLRSMFLMGTICGGAKLADDDKITLAADKKKAAEPQKAEPELSKAKEAPVKPAKVMEEKKPAEVRTADKKSKTTVMKAPTKGESKRAIKK